MTKMMKVTMGGLLATAFMLSAGMPAQANDAAYCSALVKQYERYLVGESRNRPPASVETHKAAAWCKAGDTRGIPALEQALNNARFPLPPRG
jgi:hypothetical protein